MGPKRIALWFLIASVAASAVLGVITVLIGSFGALQVRIIMTTLTISAASICALACGALWEQRRQKFLSLGGAILALVAAILIIAGIWTKTSHESFWKFTASVGLVAAATAHVCLLSLAKLAPRFAWNRVAASAAVYLLAGLLIYIIYATPEADTSMRIVGATSIIVAALTIMTPIFHRLSRGDLDESGRGIQNQELFKTITCPQCGNVQANRTGTIVCPECDCSFAVNIIRPGRLTKTD